MAPKGGKGGGSSSSSSKGRGGGCTACTAPLVLAGSDWKDGKILGLFALDIVAIAIIFLCLIFSLKFTLTKESGARDRLRGLGYKIAASFAILSFIISVVDTSLSETHTTVVYLYYILFVFNSFVWRVAEVLLLAIILRINSASGLWKRMHILHVLAITVVALATAAAFGLYTARIVQLIRYGLYATEDYVQSAGYANVAYSVFYFLVSCLAALEAVIVLLKARSKATLVTCAIIIPALFLRSLIQLAAAAVNVAPTASYNAVWDLQWAASYIEVILTPAIFVGIVLVGYLLSRKGRSGSGSEGLKQTEYQGPSYAPVNTYG